MSEVKMEYKMEFKGFDYDALNTMPLLAEYKIITRAEVADFLTAFQLNGISHHHVSDNTHLKMLGIEKYADVHVFHLSGYAMSYDCLVIVPDFRRIEKMDETHVILTSKCFHEWRHTSGNHRGDNYYKCSKCQEEQYVDSSD